MERIEVSANKTISTSFQVTSPPNPLRNKTFTALAYIVGAFIVWAMWLNSSDTIYTSFDGDPRSTFPGLLNGTAHRPFVERALVPYLTRSITAVLPDSAASSCRSWFVSHPKIHAEVSRLGWDMDYLLQYLVAVLIALLALVGFVFLVRKLFKVFYHTDTETANAVPLLVLAGLPLFFHVGTHYIYDFPTLFLFTAGLILILRERWLLLYVVYIAGLWNKETMALIVVPFILWEWNRMNRNKLVGHVAGLIVVSALVKIALALAFSENPGQNLEFHFFANVRMFLTPYSIETLVVGIVLLLLIFFDISKKPFALRQGLWLVVPFGFLMLLFAYINEIRDAYEVYPIIALLIVHTILFSLLKIPFTITSHIEKEM